jgi:hypothetical protein
MCDYWRHVGTECRSLDTCAGWMVEQDGGHPRCRRPDMPAIRCPCRAHARAVGYLAGVLQCLHHPEAA